jgi:hypothetical protein
MGIAVKVNFETPVIQLNQTTLNKKKYVPNFFVSKEAYTPLRIENLLPGIGSYQSSIIG